MRSLWTRLGVTCLAGAVCCASVPGCGGSSDLEKPAADVDLKPDMNKMPGFNEMQKDLKAKKKIK